MSNSRAEHGSGLIEFIFVAPIILLLAGSTLEVARFLRFRQIAGVLTQEAANRAYRQCADITLVSVDGNGVLTVNKSSTDPNKTQTEINIGACLATVKTAIDVAAEAAGLVSTDAAGLPVRSALTISVYRHDIDLVAPADPTDPIDPMSCVNSTGTVTRILPTPPTTTPLPPIPASKFTTTGGEIIAGGDPFITAQNVCIRGRIVIAELFFPYRTIINYRVFGIGFDTDLRQSGFTRTDLGDFRETPIL